MPSKFFNDLLTRSLSDISNIIISLTSPVTELRSTLIKIKFKKKNPKMTYRLTISFSTISSKVRGPTLLKHPTDKKRQSVTLPKDVSLQGFFSHGWSEYDAEKANTDVLQTPSKLSRFL